MFYCRAAVFHKGLSMGEVIYLQKVKEEKAISRLSNPKFPISAPSVSAPSASATATPPIIPDKTARILKNIEDSVARMDSLCLEMAETQTKLALAEKRAQWAKKGVENIRELCSAYLKYQHEQKGK